MIRSTSSSKSTAVTGKPESLLQQFEVHDHDETLSMRDDSSANGKYLRQGARVRIRVLCHRSVSPVTPRRPGRRDRIERFPPRRAFRCKSLDACRQHRIPHLNGPSPPPERKRSPLRRTLSRITMPALRIREPIAAQRRCNSKVKSVLLQEPG